MISLALEECKKLGIDPVLMVCDKENIGSAKSIMKNENKKYYTAYEERYKTAHQNGGSWASNQSSSIVMEIIQKYNIQQEHCLLEVGCGEGRDSKAVC